MFQITISPFVLYVALWLSFIILAMSVLVPAVILNATKGSINASSWGVADQVFIDFFGLMDKGFPVLLLVLMLESIYVSYKYPNYIVGLMNVGVLLVSVFLNSALTTGAQSIALGFQSAQLLPIMTMFFTSPLAIYPIMLFTSICVIFNFRNSDSEEHHVNDAVAYGDH